MSSVCMAFFSRCQHFAHDWLKTHPSHQVRLLNPGCLFAIDQLLSADECRDWLLRLDKHGFAGDLLAGGHSSFRRYARREYTEEEAPMNELWRKVRPWLPSTFTDAHGGTWHLVGLNSFVRANRYAPGDYFAMHRDVPCASTDGDIRSFLTLNVYLNDVDVAHGGATRFYADVASGGSLRDWDPAAKPECQVSIQPQAGCAVVFAHGMLHDGQELRRGTKYLVRTDVLYSQQPLPLDNGGWVRLEPMVNA